MKLNRRGFLGALAATAGVPGAVSVGKILETEARIQRAFLEDLARMLATQASKFEPEWRKQLLLSTWSERDG